MSVARDLRTLLRFSGFRRLLAVRLLSQLADGVYQVALAAYVVFSPEKETSAAAIASAMAVLLLPYSLLGPFAGVLLDRWRRRQVLLYGNVLRTGLATLTATLVLGAAPEWLVYLSALTVTAVNRFVLAGLSASLPRVVDGERLVIANSLSPTAGTLAATLGGGVAFVVRFLAPQTGRQADTLVLLTGAALYLLGALASLRMDKDLLGPGPQERQLRVLAAVASTVRGLRAGLRHLGERRLAAYSLAAATLMRFCYGALTVMVLMLCRYAWNGGDAEDGLGLLGVALGLSGAGFFSAAVLTPSAVRRVGIFGWIALCSGGAALLEPALGLPFAPVPILIAAFVLGLVTQAAKIATDTAVQISVDDAYRGRVFSLYDMLYNVAYVGAAGTTALILPPDGRSTAVVVGVAVLYAAIALAVFHVSRETGDSGKTGSASGDAGTISPAGPPTTP
ncbi:MULTISPECIES: MFS transporter [unclassified Streptomyces]|uniref:MFS transporter n=1 Tax=unclassified Streptomyces TaxID=2593676 RepID=UPI002DD8CAFB|nr:MULTISPECIES: MFS transporter [unclassified Streptomyces]WSA93648.1 MFS transporter [Streptomyces sp. NBC_01795]WSB78020.1 MFS transporter [Streptomyces sp. NBC_01775]WSS13728.1 MFS transporter [Streptomyces sp. NBC_01186]WSS42550.1 MFS transporter [Streptomyces sp. NBC_01187]